MTYLPHICRDKNGLYLARTAIRARDESKDHAAFWRAVEVIETVLVGAARGSGDSFEYTPLPAKELRCAHCAATGLVCLTVARKSRLSLGRVEGSTECQSCVVLKRDCTPQAVEANDDNCINSDDDDDDDKPIFPGARKRGLNGPTADTTTKKMELDAKVSLWLQIGMTRSPMRSLRRKALQARISEPDRPAVC